MKACPTCGEKFSAVVQHIRQSDCPYPWPNPKQQEIFEGLLMGDGHVRSGREMRNARFQLENTNTEFLRWVSEEIGWLHGSTTISTTEEMHQDGFNHKTSYKTVTPHHPYFNSLREWYSTGDRVFPEDLELTPMKLKMWYCSDGHLTQKCPLIACDNESKNVEKIKQYFERAGLPTPIANISERSDGGEGMRLRWNIEESIEIFNYMGDPVPGMEYKWPDEYGTDGWPDS